MSIKRVRVEIETDENEIVAYYFHTKDTTIEVNEYERRGKMIVNESGGVFYITLDIDKDDNFTG